MPRVGVFGWGVVAPRAATIEEFERRLGSTDHWLSPFSGFGPSNFLVGEPKFDFGAYQGWVDARFPPGRFPQLVEKMDLPTQYAIGAFIQALGQNPGLEAELAALGAQAHVYVGTGLGALDTVRHAALDLHRSQRRWFRFWAQPERNEALRRHLAGEDAAAGADSPPPPPESVPEEERDDAAYAWWEYWAARSDQLHQYLAELREIEGLGVQGEVESGKLGLIKEKQRRRKRLDAAWGAPPAPWGEVSPNLVWNLHNTPAAQISMLGRITGLAFAPVAACSTFGVALRLAMDAIARGDAKAVVLGATDPPPLDLVVGAFYGARVVAADGTVSKPMTALRGTHVAGGAVIWIVGDLEHFRARGCRPLGMEPLAVGVSSDADHIITPSKEGPMTAIRQALAAAGVGPGGIGSWDLHATATPGDYLEVENLRELLPDQVLVTARKGTFGHGMGAGGGWELTAQYLGYEKGRLFPTPLEESELNPEIARVHRRFQFDTGCAPPPGVAGKLSMGIGGINACVISRPWR
ncbi:MAG TPA: beta-ketoacyl synthase N-terminal-like domain-containing protein [Thermoanaerobaculia bacterium]|nr:beta-ketoacyl synthase N-terminal-like domain-containing protein [Thermoanaerobaculia bacterium]